MQKSTIAQNANDNKMLDGFLEKIIDKNNSKNITSEFWITKKKLVRKNE